MKIRHLLIGMLAIAGAVACKQDEPVQEPKLDVDKAAVEVAATAGEATFNVTSNQSWVASADADWVSLEPASGSASEKAVAVKVTAEDNETTEAREATVTVKAGELTKTVKVNQAAGQGGETPGPELPKSEWALVGTFGDDNNWNPASELYLSVLDEEYFVYYGLELATDSEFKFLKGGAWPPAGQEVGGNGLVEPNTIQPAGGSNIKVTEAGKYDIYLAADLTKFYIMSEGKLPAEAVEPAPVENQWGMMGCFVDNQWASDVPMTKEGEWIVAKGAQFTELTFKIRANASWADATNIGRAPGSECAVVNGKIEVVTAEYAKANLGGDAADIKLNGEPGTYDVYFSFENLEVYVMEAGFKPGEKEPQNPDPVEVTYTVVGTLADAAWVNNAPAGLMAKEGDLYVAKNVPFVWNSTCYGGDYNRIEFKIVETGTWDGFAYPEKNVDQYANAEITVQNGGENIALDAPEGNYDVYFDKANKKVWVMEPGFKPGEKEPLVPQPEPEYTLDGKQWLLSAMDTYVLIDLGLYEPGAMVIALPSMDGTGFACYMYGTYEIEKTDAKSGNIIFTQYDPEWDEFMDPQSFAYSELSESVVYVSVEALIGDPTPLPFVAVEEPYDIIFDNGGGEDPVGAIENGEYWFFNGEKVMAPLAEGETTGLLPAGNVIDGASTVKNIFTLTYDPDWTYYTIQDSYGRYLGHTDYTSGNIATTTVLPSGDDYAFYLWAVDPNYPDGKMDVYNCATFFGFAYSAENNNWYLDEESYTKEAVLPQLVKAENPVEEPVVPEGPQAISVADFLKLSVGTTEYQLTGVIEGTYNTTYGNFYLNDGTGKVLVYGLTATKQTYNDKSFASLGLRDGDKLTLIGTRSDYNGTAQVGGPAYYVSHESLPYLELSAESATVDAEATSYTLNVESNLDWMVVPSATVTPDKTAGSGNGSIVLSFAANETDTPVEHLVVVMAGTITKTFALTQKAKGDDSADVPPFTSNVTWKLGNKAYSEKATVNETSNVSVLKLGTSSVVGDATITIPAGTTKVGFYGVAWNGKSGKVTASVAGTKIYEQALASNSGAANNAPYTLTVKDTDYYEFTLPAPCEADTTVTLATVSGATRVILWGINTY